MRRMLIMLLMLILIGCSRTSPTPTPPNRPAPPVAEIAPQPTLSGAATATTAVTLPASPTAVPTITAPADDLVAVEWARRDATARDDVALGTSFGIISAPMPLTPSPVVPAIGEQRPFWVTNISTQQPFQVNATLRVQSPHLLLYVADDQVPDDGALQQAADTFERDIWPLFVGWFDADALPQTPITVLNASVSGVGGYYSAQDELPIALNPFSNEREMLVINIDACPFGSPAYIGVLTHEMQHLIQRNALSHPATWFNEGASMLSEDISGYGDDWLVQAFLNSPDTQLNAWAASPDAARLHYGAAETFLRYVNQQLPDGLPLGMLARADAGDDLEQFTTLLQQRYPDLGSFADVYATWAVANLINTPDVDAGRYAYDLPATVTPQPAPPNGETNTVQQLGADYLLWDASTTPRQIRFNGNTTIPLIAATVDPNATVWWSGRGDSRVSTLSSQVHLPDTDARLRYRVWRDIEDTYDYAYFSISSDGGTRWQTLATPSSTMSNPVGLNMGNGITGAATEWREESIDLTPWRGQTVLLRVWYITDQAFNAQGLALDDLRVDDAAPLQWQAAGFVPIRNAIPQVWELRLVTYAAATPQVQAINVIDGTASWTVPADTRAVLVISGGSSATTQPATYSISTTP